MAKCDYCGSTILIGGKREGQLRFCTEQCRQHGAFLPLLPHLPPKLVESHLHALHRGNCPRCQGPGPVDVHTSYKVWSALVLTSWSSTPQICCRICGHRSQLKNLLFSILFGWWGFPWGPILTPVLVTRNLRGILNGPQPFRPSPALERLVRTHLAAQMMQEESGTRLAA